MHAEEGRLHEVLVRQGTFETPGQGNVRSGKPDTGEVAQANALALRRIGIGRFQVVVMQSMQALDQAEEVVLPGGIEQAPAQIRGCVPLRIGHA